jgi:phosphoenolpyruvate-protein phosphotransferase (PTS system enzyme I)
MISIDKKKTNLTAPHKNSEKKLRVRVVSRGIAVGNVVCLHGNKRQFYRVKLQKSQVERELRRFRAAVRLAKRHLRKLSSQKDVSLNQAQIFDSHHMILEDTSLLTKIEAIIQEEKVNAEWAVKSVTDRYIAVYKDIQDEHLRERHIDLEDVTERLLTALAGGNRKPLLLKKDSIIVAKEVRPSTLVELSRSNLKAIIAESGGWTSHTFILARELNLPAVTGAKGILRRVQTGDRVIVDGFNGQVILNSSDKTLRQYKATAAKFQQFKNGDVEVPKGKLQTLDGRAITIRANLDISKDYQAVRKFGGEGVGLFRSEFLFNQNQDYPSEGEQCEAYRKIADQAGEDGVKVRTFDLTIEQVVDESENLEKNPALGLRAVRLSLAHEKQFRAQLRAILQASFGRKLDIVLPMISDVAEIRRAKAILEEEKKRLRKRKINYGEPKIGAMIEVPAAVMMIEEIAEEVDFLNLGTNDLVQYLLAVDRDNEAVADWFRTLHPAILRALKKVVEAADKLEKPLIICGEMAGSPVYATILVGLGVRELSMNINSISRIRHVVSNIAFEEAREIVKSLETCKTPDETEEKVRISLNSKFAHLFPEKIFFTKKI